MSNAATAVHVYSGYLVDPFSAHVNDIRIEDIAHALSNICRFGGHTDTFYSVAQHSLMVAYWSPKEYRLWGLLHDAAEAYLGDLCHPIKHNSRLGGMFQEVENKLLNTIAIHFELGGPMPQEVRQADTWMLCAEARDFCGNPDWVQNYRSKVNPPLDPVPELQPMNSEEAETKFLLTYYRVLHEQGR